MPLCPGLTNAFVPLLDEVEVLDKLGRVRHVYIPGERPLTTYLSKHELVTLIALDGTPEAFISGYLCSQRLINNIEDIASTQAGQEAESAAVSAHAGIVDLDEKIVRRTATIGYGQGTMFGSLTDEIDAVHLPPDACMTQTMLCHVADAIRLRQSIYKQVGSVHGCALLDAYGQLLHFTEDVGRRNAVDAIADRMWFEGTEGGDKILYTTDRLTPGMVTEGAQTGTSFLLSRLDVTQMGHRMAQRVNLTLFARCMGRHFLFHTGRDRFMAEPEAVGVVGPCGRLLQAVESGR